MSTVPIRSKKYTAQHPYYVPSVVSDIEQTIWAMGGVAKNQLREAMVVARGCPKPSSNGVNTLSVLALWHEASSELIFEFNDRDELAAVHMLMLAGFEDPEGRMFMLSLAQLDFPSLDLREPETVEGRRESGLFVDKASSSAGWLRASIYLSCDA